MKQPIYIEVPVDKELPEENINVFVKYLPKQPLMEGVTIGIDKRQDVSHLPKTSIVRPLINENGFTKNVIHWLKPCNSLKELMMNSPEIKEEVEVLMQTSFVSGVLNCNIKGEKNVGQFIKQILGE